MLGDFRQFANTGAAVLLSVWAALSPAAASATPTVREAASFARRELNRLCGDPRLSRFDRVNDAVAFRTCSAEVSPSGVTIELRYRSAEGDNLANAEAQRGGTIVTSVRFRNDSWFFCDSQKGSELVGLHVSCEADVNFDGQRCVERKETARRIDTTIRSRFNSQSIAQLIQLSPENCSMVVRSLNFLVKHGGTQRKPTTRDYFLQN